MPRRLMVLIPQHPFDPASGAPRSDRAVAELLAMGGYEVRFVAATASEAERQPDPEALHARLGLDVRAGVAANGARPVYRFTHRGVDHTLIRMPCMGPRRWGHGLRREFERFLLDEFEDFRPDLLMTWGSTPAQIRWRGMLRDRGVAVVFNVQNLAYLMTNAFPHVDAVLTCSSYMARRYHDEIGLEVAAFSPPMADPPLPPAPPEPGTHVVQLNMSREKGMALSLRVFAELARTRPDVPAIGVIGRARREELHAQAEGAGIDLSALPNVELIEPVADPDELYAKARLVLHPSMWVEPCSRVVAECACRGIPVVCSDLGGQPESAGEAGVVLPIPRSMQPSEPGVMSAADVRPWTDAVLQLVDDDAHHAAVAGAGLEDARHRYSLEHQVPRYTAFFDGVTRGPDRTWGPGVVQEGEPRIPELP